MSLRSVNLNLVPVLHSLLREQSVSLAAQRQGMAQSAASDALKRLRIALNDPLLVRIGGRMALTPYAVTLIDPVEALDRDLQALFQRQHFDPEVSERTFVIATVDSAIIGPGSSILRAIAAEAPKICLRFVDVDPAFKSDLAERKLDFALVPSFAVLDTGPPTIRFRSLICERVVAVFREGHPLALKDRLSEDDFAGYRLLFLDPPLAPRLPMKFQIQALAPAAAYLRSAAALPHLVLDTDYFGIVPESQARDMARMLPLQWRPLTFLQTEFDTGIAWSPVQDADPGHRWFREVVDRRCKPARTKTGPEVSRRARKP